MDIVGFIAEVSRDMDPATPGYQAGAAYVLLSVALPLAVGIAVSSILATAERVFGPGLFGDGH